MPESEAKRNPSGSGKVINSAVFYTLLSLVVLSPIPVGSNRAWSWSLCALVISVLTLVWIGNIVWNKQTVSHSLPSFIPVLFLIPCIWSVFQVSNLVPDMWSHPLWGVAVDSLGVPIQPTISITPDDGLVALMRLMSYGLVFFLFFQFCRNRNRAYSVLKWLAIAGIFYALYGLIVYWGNINIFFWTEKPGDINKVTSTFVNRNNYAIYAALGLLCLIAFMLEIVKQKSVRGYTSFAKRQHPIELYIFKSWKPLIGIMLITTALISTQSRGGSISSAIAVVTLLLIIAVRSNFQFKTLLSCFGGVFLIIVMAYTISKGPLLQRMEHTQLGGSERFIVFNLTAGAIKDNPWAGFGYGSFHQGFKIYRTKDIQYNYDKTHNTFLENSFELGIPAAASLFLTVFSLMLISLKGVVRRHRDWIYPATGVAATSLVASHSLIDFSLQIPSIAITYCAVMGLAVGQSYSTSRRNEKRLTKS